MQANQRGLANGQVEQNLLRRHLDVVRELLVAVGQQCGVAGGEGEAHIGGGVHLTGELREGLGHLGAKDHGANVVQESAVEDGGDFFGQLVRGAGHDHGLGDLGGHGLDHLAPGVEGLLNPFGLGPGLHGQVVTLDGGDRIQPQVGQVCGVLDGALEVFGNRRVFAHGGEHLAGLILDVGPVHAARAGFVGCAGKHGLHLREHALQHSGVEADAHVLEVFGIDVNAEGVLPALTEERAEGVLCVGGGALTALAGCPCGGVEALLLHLLQEFFEGVTLVGGVAVVVIRHLKPFLIRRWAQPARSLSSLPIFAVNFPCRRLGCALIS